MSRLNAIDRIETLLEELVGNETPPLQHMRSLLDQLKSSFKKLSLGILRTINSHCFKIQELIVAYEYKKRAAKRSISEEVFSIGLNMTITLFEDSQFHYKQLLLIFADIEAHLNQLLDDQAAVEIREECQSHVLMMKDAVAAYEDRLVLAIHEAIMDINTNLYTYSHQAPDVNFNYNRRIFNGVLQYLITSFSDVLPSKTTQTPETSSNFTISQTDPIYLGCYKDKIRRDVNVNRMTGYELRRKGIRTTVESCMAFCSNYSTSFFALQYRYVNTYEVH